MIRPGEAPDRVVAAELGIATSTVRRMRYADGIEAFRRATKTVEAEAAILERLRCAEGRRVDVDELAELIGRCRRQTTRILVSMQCRQLVVRFGRLWRARA